MGPIAQGVISNAIWWIVFLLGSAMIAALTVTHPNLAIPFVVGVFTFACLSVIFYASTGRSLFSKKSHQLDRKNIEASVKTWIASLGLASKPVTLPDTVFAYEVTMLSGTGVHIARSAKREEYLGFHIGMNVSPEHRTAMQQLTPQQALIVVQELSLELARLGASFRFNFTQNTNQNPTPNQLEVIHLIKEVPYASLSEAGFTSHLVTMDSGGTVVRAVLALALQRYAPDPQLVASVVRP